MHSIYVQKYIIILVIIIIFLSKNIGLCVYTLLCSGSQIFAPFLSPVMLSEYHDATIVKAKFPCSKKCVVTVINTSVSCSLLVRARAGMSPSRQICSTSGNTRSLTGREATRTLRVTSCSKWK
jgi:hypothetical protein